MKALWRNVKPERPLRKGNTYSTKWTTLWAFDGIGIEADSKSDWLDYLSIEEVMLVSKHLFRSEQYIPDWMDDLLEKRWDIAAPFFREELKREWGFDANRSKLFLSHYSYDNDAPAFDKVARLLLSVVLHNTPTDPSSWSRAADILTRLDLSKRERKRLVARAKKILEATNQPLRELPGLFRLLLWLNPNDALKIIDKALKNGGKDNAESLFSAFFARRHGNETVFSPNEIPLNVLTKLVRLGYKHIRVEDDVESQEGSYTPTGRHHAEDGRWSLLSMLLERNTEGAYRAVRSLGGTLSEPARQHWMKVLSKRMIERQTGLRSWSEQQIYEFHETMTAPILTGDDFYMLVLNVLDEIERDICLEDATSRAVALEAKSEDDIRDWLMEQLRLRIGKHASSVRENHVAGKKRPDILVISRDIEADVVIEVKHSGKGWTPIGYLDTLYRQLSKRYLRVERRRHGILFISVHKKRKYWFHPVSKKHIYFPALLEMLRKEASRITASNDEGWTLNVMGIDFTSK